MGSFRRDDSHFAKFPWMASAGTQTSFHHCKLTSPSSRPQEDTEVPARSRPHLFARLAPPTMELTPPDKAKVPRIEAEGVET